MVQCSGVMWWAALPLHSSRVVGIILCLNYCLCGFSRHVLPVSAWISWVTSQNMPVGWIRYDKLSLSVNKRVCTVPCDVLILPKH